MTTPQAITATILQQLGGNRFVTMTGARDFLHSQGAKGTALHFRIPTAKQGINRIRVTLNAGDLYDVEFFNLRGVNLKLVDTRENVFAENLRQVFTTATGLETSL